MKWTNSRILAGILILACFVPIASASNRAKSLPPRYRQWLSEDVTYIINSNEKKEFLALTTDAERDSFIDAFWRLRNPDPDSGANSYKEEHYRRLAYANEHFGSAALQDGWRTDEGRMYIILGAPKQIVTYPAARNVRPMEIWFYQSPSRALPPYFNLIFYKRSIGEPYTLYSPMQDGPARLVSTLEAMNDQKRSLEILRKSLGDEVAKTSLSLLPDESVNLDEYEPTMSSDLLLSTIAGLPDNPLTLERLNLNRLRERVTTGILTGGTALELSYGIFRNDHGNATVSYLLEARTPDPKVIGRGPDKSLEYDFDLRTDVQTAAGKPVYEQVDELAGKVTETEAQIAGKKRFGAEARLPLAPGDYVVAATLTNNLTRVATQQKASIRVPAPRQGAISISPLVVFTAPVGVPDPTGTKPFSASRVRFTPRGAQSVILREGEKLPLVFQLWLDPKAAAAEGDAKIHVRYVFGNVAGGSESATTEEEEIDPSNRDAAGNLLTGHTVDTSQLTLGTYRLVVSANWDGKHQTAYETMLLRVVPDTEQVDSWTAYGGVTPDVRAVDDLKRGLSAEAQGEDDLAESLYADALGEGQAEVRPFDRLAALEARRGETDKLAALSQQPLLSNTAVFPGTLVVIASALSKAGNPKGIVRMLEAQIKLQPPSAELYRTLADACEATGDRSRASDLRAMAAGASQTPRSKN
ncbi:MAG: GWxTD domain-containing protein [Terracidiphilus sp.]